MKVAAVSALAAVLVAGTAVLSAATDGFKVATTEGERRLSVERNPRPLPDAVLEDQDGRRFRLADLAGKVVLTEFIYTRCATICGRLADSFADITTKLPDHFGRDLILVSISLDPEHDGIAELGQYAHDHGADGRAWRVARPLDETGKVALLQRFGVVAIPDGVGGFEHNGAVQLIDRHGRLARVYDFTPVDQLVTSVQPWLGG